MDNIFRIISKIAIFFIILGSLFFCINDKDQIIENSTFRYFIIKSESMYPTLKMNDIIIVKKQEKYNVGDIITYKYNNEYFITHRIIKVYNNLFSTKGDNNNVEDDEKVEINNVKGKVVFIINEKNRLLIISYIVVILVILISFKYLKYLKKEE